MCYLKSAFCYQGLKRKQVFVIFFFKSGEIKEIKKKKIDK